jgi:hypothetical protein
MRRVYVETSVRGMIPPGQNETLRQPALEFFNECDSRVLLACISDIVADEIRDAPTETRTPILQRMAEIDPVLLPVAPEVLELAGRFVDEGVVPKRRIAMMARHVACAIASKIELLVSWNYRHSANARKAGAFHAVAVLPGYAGNLQIHAPLEVLESLGNSI